MNTLHIFVASVNFQRLDRTSDKVLNEIAIENTPEVCQELRQKLGFEIEQIAVINKCNAVSIVVSFFGDYDESFIIGRISSSWDDIAPVGLANAFRYVKTYQDEAAFKYLSECALGLNSVTVGDSQVLAQVTSALTDADEYQQDGYRAFPQIATTIKRLAFDAKTTTELYSGSTSLERVATELFSQKSKGGENVLVLGAGRTGSLIVKILATEFSDITVSISNRTQSRAEEISKKHPSVHTVKMSDLKLASKASHVFNALPNTAETQNYMKTLLKKLPAKTPVYDLSSPSIVASLPELTADRQTYTVQVFSEIAAKHSQARKSEVDKVRAIISNQVADWSRQLSRDVAKSTINNIKKTAAGPLDASTLSILRVRNDMNKTLRTFFDKKKFLEVTSPYIVGVSTDPPRVDKGNTFAVDWPDGGRAFLRQSNQLYKQMIVASGADKIFEIGPFWRAEESTTYRHLLESTGLDVEFANPKDLASIYTLAYESIIAADKSIAASAGVTSPLSLPPANKVPVLTYNECVELLRSKGHQMKYGQTWALSASLNLGRLSKKNGAQMRLLSQTIPIPLKSFIQKNVKTVKLKPSILSLMVGNL
jgi:glutamyl-tRNA reductase